ncbi:N-methyl-L-tryptophan oxidase [Dactylosporangium vinaceum]|uniref:N-methyl-L-tryptophan oxidase n=1 Tax=Dactylosporangium vinaceum TaxID=53362 RepID=A0ABV5M0B0_9ACTN|nr:N-methyl-L-tryptophan oxidase [Dactylosporangium vinaceum]
MVDSSMGYDVIVAGLGGMGSSAAYHLARRGRRVLGLERFGAAHDLGSSHGGSRITRQAYFEHPDYVPMILRSYELWEQLQRDSGRDLLTITGGLFMGPAGSLTVDGTRRTAERWNLPHEMLDAQAIRRRFPQFRPADDDVALFERLVGVLRPEAAVEANLALAGRHGAELHFHEPVEAWTEAGGRVTVRTANGTYEADQLVICPGAWAPQLLPDLGVPLVVERQVQFWFQPTSHTPEMPIFIWEDPSGTQVYGFPPIDGEIKVAFFRGGDQTTPDTIDRGIRDEEVERIAGYLSTRVPHIPGTFLRAKTCMYTNTPDTHFVIARHPGHERVTVACGFSGHGFKFVPVVGEILADLALGGATDHPIALFDPRRALATGP